MRTTLLLFAVAATGCGGSGSTAADLSMPDLMANPDLAPSTFAKGHIADDSKFPAAGTPVVGATICMFPQMAPCTTSDAKGDYELDGLPAGTNTAVSFEAATRLTDIFPLPPGWDGSTALNVSLFAADNDPIAGVTGASKQAGKAIVIANIFDATNAPVLVAPPDGATVALQPAGGDGPFYIDSSVKPPTSSTTSGTKGPLVLFLNLDPGTYSITTVVAGKTCAPTFGWPSSGGAITGPAVPAGAAISLGFGCK